jgi:hypothetical protein
VRRRNEEAERHLQEKLALESLVKDMQGRLVTALSSSSSSASLGSSSSSLDAPPDAVTHLVGELTEARRLVEYYKAECARAYTAGGGREHVLDILCDEGFTRQFAAVRELRNRCLMNRTLGGWHHLRQAQALGVGRAARRAQVRVERCFKAWKQHGERKRQAVALWERRGRRETLQRVCLAWRDWVQTESHNRLRKASALHETLTTHRDMQVRTSALTQWWQQTQRKRQHRRVVVAARKVRLLRHLRAWCAASSASHDAQERGALLATLRSKRMALRHHRAWIALCRDLWARKNAATTRHAALVTRQTVVSWHRLAHAAVGTRAKAVQQRSRDLRGALTSWLNCAAGTKRRRAQGLRAEGLSCHMLRITFSRWRGVQSLQRGKDKFERTRSRNAMRVAWAGWRNTSSRVRVGALRDTVARLAFELEAQLERSNAYSEHVVLGTQAMHALQEQVKTLVEDHQSISASEEAHRSALQLWESRARHAEITVTGSKHLLHSKTEAARQEHSSWVSEREQLAREAGDTRTELSAQRHLLQTLDCVLGETKTVLASADFDSVHTIKLWVVSVVDRARQLLQQQGITQTPASSLATHPNSTESNLRMAQPKRPVPPHAEPPPKQHAAFARPEPPPRRVENAPRQHRYEPTRSASEDDAMRLSKFYSFSTWHTHDLCVGSMPFVFLRSPIGYPPTLLRSTK